MITATFAKETPEVKVSTEAKNQIIAVCCLAFFPLMYLVGTALVNLF